MVTRVREWYRRTLISLLQRLDPRPGDEDTLVMVDEQGKAWVPLDNNSRE